MAIKVMAQVWATFPRGGSELLALLALADWSDDDGRCYPSMSSIATKTRLSRSQAQRIVHTLITDGFVQVVGNKFGGAPGATRQYRIVLSALTGRSDAAGSTDATGCIGAADGSQVCGETGSTHATQTVIEPSITVKENHKQKKKGNLSLYPKASEVIDYLNVRSGKTFRAVDVNLKVIAARLEEGATVEDCKAVIDGKVKQWINDPKMREYLRPATLFNETKFAQYVGEGASSTSMEVTWE